MKIFAPVILLALLQTSAFAQNSALQFYLQKKINRASLLQNKGLGLKLVQNIDRAEKNIDVPTFNQKIDHFHDHDSRTFKQRYFVDTDRATGKAAPVIYILCGEGTCDGASSMPETNALAKKLGANLIALEHRYYGYSQPFGMSADALSAEHLQYLTVAQALEDLAEFQKYAQKVLGFTGKWISVGGSYPGALSAFYRLKHPELISGALASSAPVLAKADFIEYDRHVARIAKGDCLNAIQSVVAKVEEMLKTEEQTKKVKTLFRATDVENNIDFLYNLADMAATAIQYGYQKQFCSALITAPTVESYAKAGLELFDAFGITPFQDSFQGAMSENPKDYLGFAGMRAWMYQSCIEFGYYQTANPNKAESSRSQQISLSYHHDACKRLFGITTPVNEYKTNQKYYLNFFDDEVKNIFFTNGANDPWSNLSITQENPGPSSNSGLTLMTIAGAAHCDDLGQRPSVGLTAARMKFTELAQKWLGLTTAE